MLRGETNPSPLETARTARAKSAGSASLRRNPRAPASSIRNTYSSESKLVIAITATPGTVACNSSVASSPDMPGIRTSIITTSGR